MSTTKDNKFITYINDDSYVKVFDYKDINSDGEKEFFYEINWQGYTDPTNGSKFEIYSMTDEIIKNIFNINTSYVSHEFEIYLNNLIIKNNEISDTNIYLDKGVYHENGKKDFGTFWTIPIKKKEIIYKWDKDKKQYIINSENDNIPIKCKSLVNALRLREKPNLNGQVIKSISKDEEFIFKELTEGYPEDKIELQSGIFGYWVKIIGNDNISGWAFSYYLDFYDNYLNSYLKYEGDKKDLSMSLNEMKLVEVK